MNNMLLQIRLFHQYYDDNLTNQIQLQPDNTTERFLSHYGFLVKQSVGLLSVFFYGSGNAKDFYPFLANLLENNPLVFNINADKPQFTIISELPMNWLGQLEYSSSDGASQPEQTIVLNLSLRNTESTSESIVGQVLIYPKDLFRHNGERINRCFDIRIKARQTYWSYYIFNRNGVRLNQPLITDNQGVLFEQPVAVTFENGETALLFHSGNKRFALSETAKTSLMLFNNQASSDTVSSHKLLKVLPIPQADNLKMVLRENKPYASSEMYVYL